MCDLACKTKIIIDGGLAGKAFEEACYGLKFFFDEGGQLKDGERVLKALTEAEDAAFRFVRVALEEVGHKGPWPHSLS